MRGQLKRKNEQDHYPAILTKQDYGQKENPNFRTNAENPDGAKCVFLEILHNFLRLFTLYQKVCEEV